MKLKGSIKILDELPNIEDSENIAILTSKDLLKISDAEVKRVSLPFKNQIEYIHDGNGSTSCIRFWKKVK